MLRNSENIINFVKEKKELGLTVGVCFGTFSVLHAGHFRYFSNAKKNFDIVVVIKIFSEDSTNELSCEHIAGLSDCDYCDSFRVEEYETIFSRIDIDGFIVGTEFKKNRKKDLQHIKEILDARNIDISYFKDWNSYSVDKQKITSDVDKISINNFIASNNIDRRKIFNVLEKISEQKALVIGDTIVDEYINCKALGVSSEAPVMVVNQLESQKYLGGAGIVAKHIASLGAKTSFISVIGDDDLSELINESLNENEIDFILFSDEARPTTLKSRFIVGTQKVFRASKLLDQPLSESIQQKILRRMKQILDDKCIVVFSDFSYGVLSEDMVSKILQIFKSSNIRFFADSQSSSQTGDILKFKNVNAIFPTEKEARMATSNFHGTVDIVGRELLNKANSEHVFMTMGEDGVITFSKNSSGNIDRFFVPSFCKQAIDVSGAGDVFMAVASMALVISNDPKIASLIGSIASAIEVSIMGNTTITSEGIRNLINQ